jgi:hypothetical protein
MDLRKNDASNNSSTVSYVFVAAVTLLPSTCLATIGGYTYRLTGRIHKVLRLDGINIGFSHRKDYGRYTDTQIVW